MLRIVAPIPTQHYLLGIKFPLLRFLQRLIDFKNNNET